METGADLGAARHEVSAVQHYDLDLLLYRQVFRPFVRLAKVNVGQNSWGQQACG